MMFFQEQSWKAKNKGEEAHAQPCLRGDTQGEDDPKLTKIFLVRLGLRCQNQKKFSIYSRHMIMMKISVCDAARRGGETDNVDLSLAQVDLHQ